MSTCGSRTVTFIGEPPVSKTGLTSVWMVEEGREEGDKAGGWAHRLHLLLGAPPSRFREELPLSQPTVSDTCPASPGGRNCTPRNQTASQQEVLEVL